MHENKLLKLVFYNEKLIMSSAVTHDDYIQIQRLRHLDFAFISLKL